jgi:toxin ParE1/3/4
VTLAQREHPEARAELRVGANWYDDPATGQELLDATFQARRSIDEMPGAWPPVHGWDRELVVRREDVIDFPYG